MELCILSDARLQLLQAVFLGPPQTLMKSADQKTATAGRASTRQVEGLIYGMGRKRQNRVRLERNAMQAPKERIEIRSTSRLKPELRTTDHGLRPTSH